MAERSVGTSLGREAWRRLRCNRAAMASLVVLVVVGLAAALAELTAPQDPALQRPWLGAQPPLHTHPDVWQENILVSGRPAETSPRLRRAAAVRLVFDEQSQEDFRVVLRRGLVSDIHRKTGAVAVPRLQAGLGETLLLVNEKGSTTPLPNGIDLAPGSPPPYVLGEAGRAFVLRLVGTPRPVVVEATLQAGVVLTLQRDGRAIQAQTIPGAQVSEAWCEGRLATCTHWLGTDPSGRDQLSRLLHGCRISLLVGVVATLVSLLIGVAYGAVSAWLGGAWDRMLMGFVDILYGIPFLFLVILLLVNFGRNLLILFVALGAVQWLTMARIVRAQVLSLKSREFIAAAILGGCSPGQVIGRHLVPNCLGPIVVYSTLTVPLVILEESFLAFIGLQVEWGATALDSLGSLVDAGARSMSAHPWLLIAPATTMAVILLALNILGDGLRDALDPRLRGRS